MAHFTLILKMYNVSEHGSYFINLKNIKYNGGYETLLSNNQKNYGIIRKTEMRESNGIRIRGKSREKWR